MSSHTFKVGDWVRDTTTSRRGYVVDAKPSGLLTGFVSVDFGTLQVAIKPCLLELAQDIPPNQSPIKTVKQIVGGLYGIIGVSVDREGNVCVEVAKDFTKASELRDAAKVFTELADALDEQGDQ